MAACTFFAPGGCMQPEGKDPGTISTSSTSAGSASTGLPAGCGDGAIIAPEACDDGNVLDGDGCNSDCQLSGSLVWCKAEVGYDGPGGENIGLAVATDLEGNAIIVGRVYDGELDDSVAIVLKYSSDGNLVWTQALAGEFHAVGVVTRPDDSIVVATNHRLFALTAEGKITHTSSPFETFVFQRNGLDISAEGNIAFAANTFDIGIIGALSSDLTPAWSHEVNDLAAKTQSWAVAADSEGNWLLGGTVVVETIDMGDAGVREIYEGFLRKYDAGGGLLWSQAVSSPDESHGYHLTAVRSNASNEAVTLGILTNNAVIDAPNMVITTFGEEGQLIEQITLASSESAVYGRDLAVTPAGDRIIAGTKYPASPDPAYAFVSRHSPSGEEQWNFRSALIPTRAAGFTTLDVGVTGDPFATGLQRQEKATISKILVCRIRR